MTKISQITGVAITLANTDKLEKERSDGTSEQFEASQITTLVITEVPFVIFRSTGVLGHRFKFTCDDTGMLSQPGEDLGV